MVDKENPFFQRETTTPTKPARRPTPPPKPTPPTALPKSKSPDAPSPAAKTPLANEPVPTDPVAFQKYLNARGANLTVDGVIGPVTRAAAAKLGIQVPGSLAPSAPTPVSSPSDSDVEPKADATPAPLSADQITQAMKAKYGYLGAILDIPDVAQALSAAIAGEESPEQALARLYDTPTWKNNQAEVLGWMALKPADQQARTVAQQASITTAAKQLGVTISPDRLGQIATDSLKFGWNAQQLNAAISAEFVYKPGAQTGAIGKAESALKQMASAYLMPVSDDTLADWDRRVAAGADPEDFRASMIQVAKARFPSIADLLDKGSTVADVAEPYRQAAARELGISPDAVDFNDAKWSRALSYADPKSGQRRVMDDYEWQRTLRTDEQYGWDRSRNGVAQGYRVGNALKEALGLSA